MRIIWYHLYYIEQRSLDKRQLRKLLRALDTAENYSYNFQLGQHFRIWQLFFSFVFAILEPFL